MKREEEYELLNKFVGCWKTDGMILQTETTAEIKVWGTDIYQWLPGEYFLLHKVDVFVGDDKNETFEIIGFDRKLNQYTMQHYDNNGDSGFMTATYQNGVWAFVGETLRFSGGFKYDENEFSGIWERSADGKNWKHFMNIRLTRSAQNIQLNDITG